MRGFWREFRFYCVLLPVALFVMHIWTTLHESDVPMLKVPEGYLRSRARNVLIPSFPQQSLVRGSQGTAVAFIQVEESGSVSWVQILDSPDDFIGGSVQKALSSWTFEPTSSRSKDNTKVPAKVLGKLTFFFKIVDGKGSVSSPALATPHGGKGS